LPRGALVFDFGRFVNERLRIGDPLSCCLSHSSPLFAIAIRGNGLPSVDPLRVRRIEEDALASRLSGFRRPRHTGAVAFLPLARRRASHVASPSLSRALLDARFWILREFALAEFDQRVQRKFR
jgi:hypothetical protein